MKLLDRELLMKEASAWGEPYNMVLVAEVVDLIEDTKCEVDAEPVVYCKDCKWIGPGNCCVGGLYSYQHGGCKLLKIGIADIETFYCAEGCKR